MAKRGSFGICGSCGSRKAKGAMVRHLRECLPVHFAGSMPLLLLRAQANGIPMFWVDIAAKPQARLKDVDRLLRDTWLECCGHLSEFFGSAHHKVGMNTNLSQTFGMTGDRLGYVYDFGSSTELVLNVSGIAEGALEEMVRLVARNEPPTWPCDECGQPATAVCTQCLYEGNGFCCATHASSHGCGEEVLLPVVNSPRMGVCGYTGEA